MAVRSILALKRAALQSRIDALSAQDADLGRQLVRLNGQSDGLADRPDHDGFQVAALADHQARRLKMRLEQDRANLAQEIETLARERLALDIADTKLEREEDRLRKVTMSRADLRR